MSAKLFAQSILYSLSPNESCENARAGNEECNYNFFPRENSESGRRRCRRTSVEKSGKVLCERPKLVRDNSRHAKWKRGSKLSTAMHARSKSVNNNLQKWLILRKQKRDFSLFLRGLGSESVGTPIPNSSYRSTGWPKILVTSTRKVGYLIRYPTLNGNHQLKQ